MYHEPGFYTLLFPVSPLGQNNFSTYLKTFARFALFVASVVYQSMSFTRIDRLIDSPVS